MPMFDLTRWAVVGVKDETGLGRMFCDLTALLPDLQRWVMPSVRMTGLPLAEADQTFDPEMSAQALE